MALHKVDVLGLAVFVEHMVTAGNSIPTHPRQEGTPRSIFTREDRLDLCEAVIKFLDTDVKEGSLLFGPELETIIDASDFLHYLLDFLEDAQGWIDDPEYKHAHVAEVLQFEGHYFERSPEVDALLNRPSA